MSSVMEQQPQPAVAALVDGHCHSTGLAQHSQCSGVDLQHAVDRLLDSSMAGASKQLSDAGIIQTVVKLFCSAEQLRPPGSLQLLTLEASAADCSSLQMLYGPVAARLGSRCLPQLLTLDASAAERAGIRWLPHSGSSVSEAYWHVLASSLLRFLQQLAAGQQHRAAWSGIARFGL
jgi:hypothetical protein